MGDKTREASRVLKATVTSYNVVTGVLGRHGWEGTEKGGHTTWLIFSRHYWSCCSEKGLAKGQWGQWKDPVGGGCNKPGENENDGSRNEAVAQGTDSEYTVEMELRGLADGQGVRGEREGELKGDFWTLSLCSRVSSRALSRVEFFVCARRKPGFPLGHGKHSVPVLLRFTPGEPGRLRCQHSETLGEGGEWVRHLLRRAQAAGEGPWESRALGAVRGADRHTDRPACTF